MNVFVFLQEVTLSPEVLDQLVFRMGVVPLRHAVALREAPLNLGAWLVPMLSAMFLHGGWAHLIGNMVYLWIFGDGLENRLGHLRFMVFYLVAGMVAAQAQVLANPLSAVPMIGASGAIAGVMGAYVLLYPHARITLMVPIFFFPFFFDISVIVFGLFWFGQQLMLGTFGALTQASGQAGGVAWWAHAGGFLGGAVLLPLLLDRKHQGHRPPRYDDPRSAWRPY
ncbi:MAG TPA: rhomboid family intramembrane serine protease [Polyangiaceae bacterium]|nr:rhomboid family intramembrane serine protease [Polyangiaceae bacterium]